MRLVRLPLAAVAVLALAGTADAQLTFQFADVTGTPQSSFFVPVGETVSIRIYLRDTTAGAPTLSANSGLGSSAVRLTYDNSASAFINLSTGISPATPPWEFGNSNGSVANASGVVNVGAFNNGVLPTGDRVLLGTFTFTANSLGDSNLSAIDRNPGSNTNTTYFVGGGGLDSIIDPASATLVVVSPVPEPMTVFGFATATLFAGSFVARRLRASRPKTPTPGP